MELIDGTRISNNKRTRLKEKIDKIRLETGKVPGLATILVGNDHASQIYINSKIKACKDVGIKSFHYNLDLNTSQANIINLIKNLNKDSSIDGILLQLPLPYNQNARNCINAINPLKDVDGLNPFNVGLLNISKNWDEIVKNNIFVPCTPLGIMNLLHLSNIIINGKTTIVIGRSNLVGKPLSTLLLANNATVIMAHSKTKNLQKLCKIADIIVIAVGKPKFLDKNFINDGVVIIDVGINRITNKICGDVNIDLIKDMKITITPVPGGVGPMTITMLLENTLKAFNINRTKK
ncbi:MAG: bifunctional 5,10-methylenetetrahydrofolate dehydrogenase/5,10-methenyltetrahydrofolate cyclohydrolase [Endomicrobium sp.]|jgi:methylenetetrahydrofolate dehydrogenase (NADP+)/methenyltetrahydrofolate cyclohydrolase|nr:bifunctional 5,10-methylenetetrahydrofolate dehydrogenase/5,10-methenyltetrahydrofolate cyclohydrolase [Endomicrobium sp.]